MANVFQAIDRIKPLYDVTYKVTLFICKLLLVADIAITCFSVAGRYIPFIPDPAWTEEVVLTLMAYMAVLSAALAIRNRSHIRMTAFDKYIPEKVIKVLDILDDICVFLLAIVMVAVGLKFSMKIGARAVYSSMPFLSKFWKYFPVPMAGIAMIIFELEALYGHIKSFFIKESDAQ